MGRVTRTEEAYRKIKDHIQSGSYKKGDRLTQLGLCEALKMSRTPVREALKILERDGYVDLDPGMGVYVRGVSSEDIREIFEVREGLEPVAARLAACRAGRRELAAIEAPLLEMEAIAARGGDLDIKALHKAETAFHHALMAASGNRRLIAYAETAQLDTFWLLDAKLMAKVDPGFAQALAEHRRLFELVRDGKTEEAETAARDHVRQGLALIDNIPEYAARGNRQD